MLIEVGDIHMVVKFGHFGECLRNDRGQLGSAATEALVVPCPCREHVTDNAAYDAQIPRL